MEPVVQVEPTTSEADFKAVLSRFCTGVTVITALTGEQPVGFSCQSFSSLSIDPPSVCFCPARTSTSWPRIRDVGRFCVNILADDQVDLCRALARSGTDKFTGVDWVVSDNGSPRLAGAMASIDCELDREVDGGDHTIVVARVTSVTEHSEQPPLLFYRSSFERLHGH